MSGAARKPPKMRDAAILVVGESYESALRVATALENKGLLCEKMSSAAAAVERAKQKEFAVIVVDMTMRDMTGLEFLRIAKAFHPGTEVLVLDGQASVDSAVNAISLGAFDYLTKPFNPEHLSSSIQRALRKRALKTDDEYTPESIQERYSFDSIVGGSEVMQEIFRLIKKVAPTTAPVIIQGESGTGKELVARAIHRNSQRRKQKFLAINSASLPETLLESELFGYRKGAFTGAHKDKVGLLQSADLGTVLLDEIGSMSRQLQGKLLRAMQEGEIIPVGSSKRVRIDVRFLAASNRNLWEMVELGEFRRDLYYRLNVIEITVPPLRERRDDIPLLSEHFLQKHCEEHGMPQKVLGNAALRKLVKHNWPGNVRELENVIRSAVIVSSGRVIKAGDISLRRAISPSISARTDLLSMPYRQAKRIVESEFQRTYLARLLSESGGSVSRGARRAGLSRQGIYEIVKKYGLKKRPGGRSRL